MLSVIGAMIMDSKGGDLTKVETSKNHKQLSGLSGELGEKRERIENWPGRRTEAGACSLERRNGTALAQVHDAKPT